VTTRCERCGGLHVIPAGMTEEAAYDEALEQLARYDAGKPTYGHHAAEAVGRAIREIRAALSRARGEKTDS
jgi:hypothetical protein